jgi:hypothetical protein
MTTITMNCIGEAFLVIGKDIEARKFESRREAKDWCASHYPGSPIHEIGADSSKRISRAMPRKGPLLARGGRKIKNPAESGGVL